MLVLLVSVGLTLASGLEVPDELACTAAQTAGFHDYPKNAESYEPVVFFESAFALEVNKALTLNLAQSSSTDVFITLRDDEDIVELSCHQVRGVGDTRGLSCSNEPPAAMLLLNLDTLRFTRTAIGGWTFTGAQDNVSGDSIFVEYGQCAGD